MRLTVTTPHGYLVQAEVEELVAPGALGELVVLPGHIPLMSALKPGVLWYRQKDGVRYLAVADGIMQVARGDSDSSEVEVLVTRGAHGKDVNREAARQELAQLETELAKTKPEATAELGPLQDRRAWAAAQIDAAERSQGR